MGGRKIHFLLSISFIFILLIPQPAHADIPPVTPSVVINELQFNGSGTKTTDQEFIELKNISADTIDITGWRLQYIASTGNLATAKYFVTFPATTLLYSNGFLLITPDTYLTSVAPKVTYTINSSFSGMASTGGTVVLANKLDVAIDTVGWGTKTTTIAETDRATAPPDGSSIQRLIIDGKTVDTNNNKNDFEVITLPTPQTDNIAPVVVPLPDPTPSPTPDPTPSPDTSPDPSPTPDPAPTDPVTPPDPTPPADTTTPPATDIPAAIPPVEQPILLNELMVDPASPLTDANDEWVELYNPNNTAQDLVGYSVFTGDTYAYHYTFPSGIQIAAHGYLSITSGNTSIALANGGGAAKIVGPSGQIYDQTTYETAKTGDSWAKDSDGHWVWTTTPTEDAANIISDTTAQAIVATAASTAKKTTKTTTTKTAATPKATTTKVTKVKAATTTAEDTPALVDAPAPVPIWLLAGTGVLAVLYSGYEYRFDLSNKFNQLRSYRAARANHRRQT